MSDNLNRPQGCHNCGSDLHEGARFCHNCGHPVGSASEDLKPLRAPGPVPANLHRLGPRQYLEQVAQDEQLIAPERRIVTTLFCDVVGSTSMAEKLDPEEVTTLMNDAFSEMIEPVHRYEGTLARLMGDGVLCLFGAPLSHEDDAVRACRAATDIMSGIDKLSRKVCDRYGLTAFDVRIGISTGLAVVGEVGTEIRSEYTAMGDAVNLAARLQHAASPGEILVCGETWKLINDHFSYHDSNTLQVRGRSQPVNVYSLGIQKGNGQTPGSGRRLRMVGRQAELAALTEAVERLGTGTSGIVTIFGRAGVGKTRLLQEARRVMPAQFRWIEATCMAYMQTESYWVVRDFVSQLINLKSPEDGSGVMHNLRAIADEIASSRAAESPEFAELALQHAALSTSAVIGQLLREDLNERESSFIAGLSAESLNHKILSEVISLVRHLAGSGKLVCVFEDVHWTDPESFLMLKMIARKLSETSILLILVSRLEHKPVVDEIAGAAKENATAVTELQLDRLSPAQCRELAEGFFEKTKIPEEVLGRIVEVTEGNAFFLQEMLRAVADSMNGNEESDNPASIASLSIPQTVQAAILSRVDQLSTRNRAVIQTAAVLGRTFRLNHLIQMLQPYLPVEHVGEALHTLVKRSFLSVERCQPQSGDSQTQKVPADNSMPELKTLNEQFPECELYFTHALLQEVVYGTLLYSKRRELHTRAGETLESMQSADGHRQAALLAFHFDRGSHPDRAIRHYSLAARQAADICSLDSAFSAYSRALELVTESNGNADCEQVSRLYEGIGDVHFLRSEYQTALDNFDKAHAITAVQLRRAELLFKRGKLLQKWGRFDDARKALETAMDSLKEDFDEQLAGKIYAELGLAYYHLHNLEIAEELGSLALILERNTSDRAGIAQASNNLGVVLTKKGDFDRAHECFAESVQIGAEKGDSYGLAACYNNWGLLAIERQDWPEAVRRLEKSRELFEMFENMHGLARVYDNLSHVYYSQNERAKAEEYLNKAVSILAEIGVIGEDPQPEMWQSGAW